MTISLRIDHPVQAYVRRTYQGRFSDAAEAYHANQEALKTRLFVAMIDPPLQMFEKSVKLRLSATIARAPEKKWIYPETKKPYQRTTHPARIGDLSNFLKALEDAGNGILWADDRQVWEYGECRKLEDETDWFSLKVELLEEQPDDASENQ